MSTEAFENAPEEDKKHFQQCECGEYFDRRDLDEVFFHCVADHIPQPDIPYGGCTPPERRAEG